MRKLICVTVVAVLMCIGLSDTKTQAEPGDTLRVPQDYSTIQAAINAATDGDTVLVADGTYTGAGNRNIDFDGKAITVKSENGPDNCIIDCQDDGRGFYFHNDETSDSIVEGFTIKNGDTGIYYGAGIYCYDGASPTITNCIFEDNSTRRGGAIACKKNSSPTISNCIMKNNWALYGGGVWCYDDSDATIKDCVIINNTADNNGGGIQSYDSNPTITNCLIANNEAISPGVGGGVYFYEGSVGTLTNCTIANNDGRYGGGVSALGQGTTMTLNNTIIWGNHASTYGHQIRAYGYGAVVLNYCDYANGDNDVNTSSQGTVTPSNCINSDPDFVDDANGDYHLDTGSPCIDAGSNSYVDWDYDLAGNWRIIHGTVEIGAYEYGIFKDRAADRGIQGPSGGAENVVWEDFNGDGYPDMYVTSTSGSNILYINDGPPNQTFTDATQANGVAGPTNSRGACAADYDNDGDVDLLVCNESGDLYLYRNNRVGLETNDFTEVAADAGLSGFSYSVMACWGDYDNDSYVDLYVVKSQDNCMLFKNDGDGTFTDVTSTAGVSGPSSGSSAVWCDIDSDNKLDLFVVGPVTGSAKLYQNEGDGTFSDITSSAGAAVEGKSVSFGDIDNDGDFDFCVAVAGAANYLLKNDYNGTTVIFADIASSAGIAQPTNAVDCYFVDFDNDGDIDLNITADDGNSKLYSNNGNETFAALDDAAKPEPPQNAAASACQELCNGIENMYVLNGAGHNACWEQRPNGNNWIVVIPQATVSNRLGIGTCVEIEYLDGDVVRTMSRAVTAGAGWGSQGSVGLHFGLCNITIEQITSVKVIWPSGTVQYVEIDGLNKKYYQIEPGVQITDKDGNIITEKVKVCVGQKIILKTKVYPEGETGSDWQWAITPKIVENYEIDSPPGQRWAKVTEVSDEKKRQDNIAFYWVSGSDSKLASINCKIKDTTYVDTVQFEVQQPSLNSFISSTGEVLVDEALGYWAMHFGDATTPGAKWTAKVKGPNDFDGQIKFTQRVSDHFQRTKDDDSTESIWIPEWWLDTRDPYANDFYDLDAGASVDAVNQDHPHVTLERPDWVKYETVFSKFEVYAMYKPDTGVEPIWVPVGVLAWGWKGVAEWDAQTNRWEKTSGAADPPDPGGGPTTNFPTWTDKCVADEATWKPDKPVVDFEAMVGMYDDPMEVQFYDKTQCSRIDSWTWQFGDGNGSNKQHPRHTYQQADTYTVTLTVTGLGGTGSAQKAVKVPKD